MDLDGWMDGLGFESSLCMVVNTEHVTLSLSFVNNL